MREDRDIVDTVIVEIVNNGYLVKEYNRILFLALKSHPINTN